MEMLWYLGVAILIAAGLLAWLFVCQFFDLTNGIARHLDQDLREDKTYKSTLQRLIDQNKKFEADKNVENS